MSHKKSTTPLWEKMVGALGLALLCSGFIYLTWVEITNEKSPIQIVFDVNNIAAVDNHFLVTVSVKNSGLQSAAVLQVEGVLLKAGRQVETSNVQIDYLPSNSERKIGLFFKQDPRSGTLEFRALGYQEP